MKRVLCIVAILFSLVSNQLFACSKDTVVVSGFVRFPAGAELPKNAVLLISVEDVSLADAASVTLAETRLNLKKGRSNLPFKIKVPKKSIDQRFRYAVRATVKSDDQLLLVTSSHYGVLTRGASSEVEVDLEAVNSMKQTRQKESLAYPELKNRYWKLVELNGQTVKFTPTQQREVYLIFEEKEMRFKGFSGCNQLSGSYQNSNLTLSMKQVVTSRKMCAPTEMALEARFKNMLLNVLEYRINDQILTMFNGPKILARYEVVYF